VHIIPVASGKGGVGKTLIAANLSIALAKAGKRVILADLDLGASNLHLMLGARPMGKGIGTFLSGEYQSLADILMPTDTDGLSFIAGDAEIPGLANIKAAQKNRVIKQLLAQDAEYLVLDLGAGTSSNILDFFLMSGQGMIVTTPTLAATLNAYLFVKNAVFRLMYSTFGIKSKAHEYLERLRKEGATLQKAYIPSILEAVSQVDPDSHRAFLAKAEKFRPRIVMNMLVDPKDADRAQKIRRSCREYLNVDLEHLGIVYRDELQDLALSSRLPMVLYKPQSVLSQAIFRIADKLVSTDSGSDAPLNEELLDGGFQEAELEAEADFSAKMDSVEDLLHCGALSMGDLVDAVKGQQFELAQLRKENLLLKRKLAQAIQSGFAP
jgi:flagellar biosynthesis protein FlhG